MGFIAYHNVDDFSLRWYISKCMILLFRKTKIKKKKSTQAVNVVMTLK